MPTLSGKKTNHASGEALQKARVPQEFKERVRMIEYYLKQVAIIYIMNHKNFDSQVHRVVNVDYSGLQHIY